MDEQCNRHAYPTNQMIYELIFSSSIKSFDNSVSLDVIDLFSCNLNEI